MFKRGDLVFAKLKSFPWWPGIIINPEDCGRDDVKKNKLWIFWFGDHKISEVECIYIEDFITKFAEKTKKMSKDLKCAIQEVLIIIANRYNIESHDTSSLFLWAKNGFKTNVFLPFDKSDSFDLPNIVKTALKKDQFKRKYKSISEDNSEDEIVNELRDVSEGRKSLEQLCVMCCKSENCVVMSHPLFIGGVCQDCLKDLYKVIELRKGKMAVICVICGQGGHLVYCCNSACSCAYCEVCIDYMAPKETFSKILKDNDWKCYLCEPNNNVDCLIKRREIHMAKDVMVPSVSSEKVPIRVISHTNAALPVLKKKGIEVGIYSIDPMTEDKDKWKLFVLDFDFEEFHEISANVVFGSFFVPAFVADDMENAQDFFQVAFHKFLYRLHGARTFVAEVFFLFMADGAVLNAVIKSRVMQFLRVNPIHVEMNTNHVYLWTNIPPVKKIKNGKIILQRNENLEIEEDILGSVLEPLTKLFKKQ